MSSDEEEAALRRVLQWRKARVAVHAAADSASPAAHTLNIADLPTPPCSSCQPSLPSSSSSPSALLLRWLSVLRCLHSASPCGHLRALARLPQLDLVRALEEATLMMEEQRSAEGGRLAAGHAELSFCLLHLLLAVRRGLREEVAAQLLTAASRLRSLLSSHERGGGDASGEADASAVLLLQVAVWELVVECEQQLSLPLSSSQHWLQRPLQPLLPPTAFAGADVLALLPPHRPLAGAAALVAAAVQSSPSPSGRSLVRASLSTAALLVSATARLRSIAAFLHGRIAEPSTELRPHLQHLRGEAASLASFIHTHSPCSCQHQMQQGKGEEADVAAAFVDVSWSLLRASALSAFLSHLPGSAEVDWLTTLLTPCLLCVDSSSPSAASAPLPRNAQAVLAQPCLYEAAAFRRSLLPALAGLLHRLCTAADREEVEEEAEKQVEEEEGKRGSGKRRLRGSAEAGQRVAGRKRRHPSSSASSEAPLSPPSPPSPCTSSAVLPSLLCLLRTWSRIPPHAWLLQPEQVAALTHTSATALPLRRLLLALTTRWLVPPPICPCAAA